MYTELFLQERPINIIYTSMFLSRNGVDRTGLLCVVSVVLERLKVEQDVAISHVIKELRSCREQINPTLV